MKLRKPDVLVESNDLEVNAIIESVASATDANHAAFDTGLHAQVASEVERLNGLIAALGAGTAPGDPGSRETPNTDRQTLIVEALHFCFFCSSTDKVSLSKFNGGKSM